MARSWCGTIVAARSARKAGPSNVTATAGQQQLGRLMAAMPDKLLHTMLEALLEDLGYRGPRKSADEILPQLHQQSGRRLESTEAKLARLEHHMDELGSQTTAIAEEVTNVQEAVSAKFAEMHRLLDEKEAQFKHDLATLAASVASAVTEQEGDCKVLADKLHSEKEQLQRALQEENELGFIAGIAEMPKRESDIPESMLRIPSVNFQARATMNSEPICQLIQNLAFNVQSSSSQRSTANASPRPQIGTSIRPHDSGFMGTPRGLAADTDGGAGAAAPWSLSKSQPPASSISMSLPLTAAGGPSASVLGATPAREVPPSKELFIGGLPFDASEQVLRRMFEKYGAVESLDLSNVSKGFAFVVYEDIESAASAVRDGGHTIDRRTLNVRFKLPRRR